MDKLVYDVTAFHNATELPVLLRPQWPGFKRTALRVELVDEEINKELLPAIDRGDLVETADAIIDSIYVLVGMGLEFGLPLTRLWDAVQATNMAKVDPITGLVRRREDGKILKPEGWLPSDIAAILRSR